MQGCLGGGRRRSRSRWHFAAATAGGDNGDQRRLAISSEEELRSVVVVIVVVGLSRMKNVAGEVTNQCRMIDARAYVTVTSGKRSIAQVQNHGRRSVSQSVYV